MCKISNKANIKNMCMHIFSINSFVNYFIYIMYTFLQTYILTRLFGLKYFSYSEFMSLKAEVLNKSSREILTCQHTRLLAPLIIVLNIFLVFSLISSFCCCGGSAFVFVFLSSIVGLIIHGDFC